MQQNRAVCGIRRIRKQMRETPCEARGIRIKICLRNPPVYESRCQEISAKCGEAGRKTAAAVCGAEL